ncbi:hypothetical protein MPDQ_001508 [Monascus purpureus]|uniref:Uncharacterized protein n=1 Tax=Monascus purpureus TaxID=5098 RepID=A0A507R0M3_MONPU|nr:hypothetical protein MPDQ_001508 [Monascus purpureus]
MAPTIIVITVVEGTTVKVARLDATSPNKNILIANAAIAFIWPKLEDVQIDDIRAHFKTNVYGFVQVE